MMGLDMRDPRVLRVFLSLMGHVQKDIETCKIDVAVDHGLRLLFLRINQIVNGSQEFLQGADFSPRKI